MTSRVRILLGLALPLVLSPKVQCQSPSAPDTIAVKIGALTLHGLLWRPHTAGRSPAVLFNHGAYTSAEPLTPQEPMALGPAFARRGYVFLFLDRRGVGLSTDQGTPDGDVLSHAFATKGQKARNRAQLELLENEDLNEARAGLAFLSALPEVDPQRLAVAGHSFGGSHSLLLASHEPTIRAVVIFSGAAYSWKLSAGLRAALRSAVRQTAAPILLLHAANDYSTESEEKLAAELQRLKKPHRLKIYPAVGTTTHDGHNFLFRAPEIWETDVFTFLDRYLKGSRGYDRPAR